jgi:putative transposase
MCVHLLLSYIKFANRLAWSLDEILRVLQLNLFDRRPILDVLEPTSDPPTGSPEQLQLTFA